MDSPSPVEHTKEYQRIKKRLQQLIGQRWHVGDKMPPIKVLAGELGVGQNNTHLAIRELVREQVLSSRPGHGTFVTSVPESQAPSRDTLTGKVVHILLNDLNAYPIIEEAANALTSFLAERGAQVERQRFEDSKDFASHQADGIALINPSLASTVTCRPQQALVLIDTGLQTRLAMAGGYDVVLFDSEHAGFLAGQHLRQLGHQDVVYIGCVRPGNTTFDQTSCARLDGLELGMGTRVPLTHQLQCAFYTSLQGARAVGQYLALPDKPKAICAASDDIAAGFIHGAVAHGLEPGVDFQMIGFDGQELGKRLPGGTLTSIKAPMQEMGTLAGDLLSRRLLSLKRPPCRMLLPGMLLRGETTRPTPHA